MDFSRLKAYDYGVVGLFILTIVAVSLNWYSVSQELLDQKFSLGLNGWHYGLAVFTFIFMLAAVVVVFVKLSFAPGSALPSWFKEGILLMGLGGLTTLFALIRVIDVPISWELVGGGRGPGGFIALGAGLLLVGCGYLAYADRSLVTAPPAGPRPVDAARGQAQAGAVRYCPQCGTAIEADSKFCRSCGAPQ